MTLKETFTLESGYPIPKIGLGTWLITGDDARRAVRDALELGYRHIDSAEAYENEAEVGRGIRESGLKREDVFLTTKLRAEIKTYEGAKKAIEESLEKLDTGYIDLMLIHSPQPWDERGENPRNYDEGNREAWRALEDSCLSGKIRSVGLSNFSEEDIENILSVARVPVSVNQIRTHVGVTPEKLIEYCRGKRILCEAYSPLAHWRIKNPEAVEEIAKKYGVSYARLCIRYTLQLGMVTLPKTSKKERMAENSDVDFEISDADMEILKGFTLGSAYTLK
ncbi:MAG: aldo/keto reductase [Clostridia bacterium]|nr:aldo/keto reductase [Clostridia bacterium]